MDNVYYFDDYDDDINYLKPSTAYISERICDLLQRKEGIAIDPSLVDVLTSKRSPETLIRCKPGSLPPPFKSGLSIKVRDYLLIFEGPKPDDDLIWKTFAPIILPFFREMPVLCQQMRDATDKVESIISGSGMRIIGYNPKSSIYNKKHKFSFQYRIKMVDSSLRTVIGHFLINEKKQTSKSLISEVNQQEKRIEHQSKEFEIDSLMHCYLGNIRNSTKEEILKEFENRSRYYTRDRIVPLTKTQIKTIFPEVPCEIESLKLQNGHLSGRIRLAPDVIYNNGNLSIRRDLPESIISAMPGQLVRSFIDHPNIDPGTMIKNARKTKTAIIIEFDLPKHWFPSGVARTPEEELNLQTS